MPNSESETIFFIFVSYRELSSYMKQIVKYDFGRTDTTVLANNRGLRSTLDELQLEVNYIDHGEDLINLHCGIPEESKVLPESFYSLIGAIREKNVLPSSDSFPKRIKIKLSREDIQRLIRSADIIQVSDDFKPGFAPERNISKTLENDFLDKIFSLMEDNMSNDTYWVDDLSCDMNVSRSTLFRKLKNLTGQAPQSFMRNIRLERALHLLEKGQLRIAEVAYQVGFADPNYFSKCFRKLFGKSPSSFIAHGKNIYLQPIEL